MLKNINKISIKSLTLSILIIASITAMITIGIFGNRFMTVATSSQSELLERVIILSVKEIINELEESTFFTANNLAAENSQVESFVRKGNYTNTSALVSAIDDPFITGFVGAYNLKLVKIKIYDKKNNLIASSSKGKSDFPDHMPDYLHYLHTSRSPIDRLKKLTGLWKYNNNIYHSTIVPIGGVLHSGYLELVVDPIFNLTKLPKKTNTPIKIINLADNNKVLLSRSFESKSHLIPVKYVLHTEKDVPAFLITSYNDITALSKRIEMNIYKSLGYMLIIVLTFLLMTYLAFRFYIFKPIKNLLYKIKALADGNKIDMKCDTCLSEIKILTEEFFLMAEQIQQRESELRIRSNVDSLTSLANRRKFDQTLREQYIYGFRAEKCLSVILVDVDHFKAYNDTYGHLQGDKCLKKIARALSDSAIRESDLVARYGGEEFALILPCTDSDGAAIVASKIMNNIKALDIPHESSETSTRVTLSLGSFTAKPAMVDSESNYVLRADKLLYEAKLKGRNRIILDELVSPSNKTTLFSVASNK